MMLDVIFGSLVRVTRGELGMSVRDEGLVRRMGMIVFVVVLRSFAVMPRRHLMLVGCGKVVFLAREYFCHGVSNATLGRDQPALANARSHATLVT
jgi:hypothetical protein